MAKRKRLTPATPVESSSEAVLETKSGYPFGVAPPVVTRAPIAQVAGDAAQQAAIEELAGEIQTAKLDGRLVQALALDDIQADHLTRDRMGLDAEELEALKTSIKARGQQTPIEVVVLKDGSYGLISGWRRLSALKALQAETGEAHFGEVKALIKPIDTVSDSYIAMVEENEIRANLSLYERARIASEAARIGVYPTPARAVSALFANIPSAKRSKISAFLRIHDALGQDLRFPAALTERLGLAVSKALQQDPAFEQRTKSALRRFPVEDAGRERVILERALKGELPATATPDLREEIAPGIAIEMRRGRVVLSGAGVTEDLVQDLSNWILSR